jgi:aminoglycoside phosphotransferase (APT) family kinase protein
VVLNLADPTAVEAVAAAQTLVPGFSATDVRRYEGKQHHSPAFLVTDGFAKRSLALKRQRQKAADVEHVVLRNILPGLTVLAAWSHGVHRSRNTPGEAWLATDHVAGRDFDRNGPVDSAALARWIGSVHVRAVRAADVRVLPDHGPDHWRRQFEQAMAVLNEASANEHLTRNELDNVQQMQRQFEGVLARWRQMVDLLNTTPRTLTHGDLTERNIRMVLGELGPLPVVFDWETAGYGSPMIDLGLVDLDEYHDVVAAAWPGLSRDTLVLLRALGALTWTAYVIVPEAINLQSRWPHRAAGKLEQYLDRLSRHGVARLLVDPSDPPSSEPAWSAPGR